MALDMISASARYTLLGPTTDKKGGKKPSYLVSLSVCAKEALDFTRPKAVVHIWPSSKSQECLVDLGKVLPFSSTFLHVPSPLATLSPTMVLREFSGVLASLMDAYPSPDSPRLLVYPMSVKTFEDVKAQTPLLLDNDLPPATMVLAYLLDASHDKWSCLTNRWWSPLSSMTSFKDWLGLSSIHPSYYVPTSRFGKDLVLETETVDGDVDHVDLYTSNVASFSRHVYSHKVIHPTPLPSRTPGGPTRHLYHNGPLGAMTSKDHLVMTWTCSSPSFQLLLDGHDITPKPVQVSPFDILGDCLERTSPDSTSIRAHSDYFFALALWRHGSTHLKSVVTHQMEASRLFPSCIVSDLTTELLRFSSRHTENPALPSLMRDLVDRARCFLEGEPSGPLGPLATLHEGKKDESADVWDYVMTFLSAADRWYERYLVGSNTTADPEQRRWASFWEDAMPFVRGVRSLAKQAASPTFSPPGTKSGLERQFSCIEVSPPDFPPTLGQSMFSGM